MSRNASVAVVVAIVTLMSSTAASAGQALAGLGGYTCGRFGEMYRQSTAATEISFYNWAQGLMSGLDVSQALRKRTETDLWRWDDDTQKAILREYCASNPLKTYADAVLSLYSSMTKEQGLPDWQK